MPDTRCRLIGVIGNGHPDSKLDGLAHEVGTLIARSGFSLVSGGGSGVMEAASRGCAEAGGLTVGILPGTDPAEANPWVRVPVPTGMGDLRNLLVVRAAESLIAVGGAYGTLSEIALALKLGKTVVGLGTWDVSEEVVRAGDPEEAVKKAISTAGSSGGRHGRKD